MIFEEYLDRLVEASPVRMYASGIDGARVHWPWRMNKACSTELRPAFVDACDHHILDSNFNDESVTNLDVLDEAVEYGCDAAVLADVLFDPEATADALLDGLNLYDDHSFDGTILLPLQEPHAEVYREVEPATDGIDVWWGLGGVKDKGTMEKIRLTEEFREEVGYVPHVHGFGFGVTDEVSQAVRRNPDLLDSIDSSTAIQNAQTPKIRGSTEKTSVTAMRAQAKRVELLRDLTHFAASADDPAELREPGQSGLGDIAATDGGRRE